MLLMGLVMQCKKIGRLQARTKQHQSLNLVLSRIFYDAFHQG
ncbi:MAG: hypothetical protein ACI81A_001518 [Paraglaciecola sp.]